MSWPHIVVKSGLVAIDSKLIQCARSNFLVPSTNIISYSCAPCNFYQDPVDWRSMYILSCDLFDVRLELSWGIFNCHVCVGILGFKLKIQSNWKLQNSILVE